MPFPTHRPRRLRQNRAIRALVQENRIAREELIQPLFAISGKGQVQPIAAMPGQFRRSADRMVEYCRDAIHSGIKFFLLFGIPENKDERGSGAWQRDGVVQTTVRRLKDSCPEAVLICDVCLCEYTSHGHCGVLAGDEVDNDATLELLSQTAVSLAEAGADIIAPSDMMDGRVGRIRRALDQSGFVSIPILTYAAKYASSFYGPFRDAAGSAPAFGDRRGYQMNPSNRREAMREISLDLEEGADIILIKPAMPSLDVIAEARSRFDAPIGAYQVSGEYAMIEAAAANGWLDRKSAVFESLTVIKRAGADFIISYWAVKAAEWLAMGEAAL